MEWIELPAAIARGGVGMLHLQSEVKVRERVRDGADAVGGAWVGSGGGGVGLPPPVGGVVEARQQAARGALLQEDIPAR